MMAPQSRCSRAWEPDADWTGAAAPAKARCLNCQTQPWPDRCLVLNCLYRIGQLLLFPSPIFLQINSGTRGAGLLRVLVPPISYEE